MTFAWCLYAVAVAGLVATAAVAAERALRLYGRPARWVWIAAMALSLGLPFLYGLTVAVGAVPPRLTVPARVVSVEIPSLPAGGALVGPGSAGLGDLFARYAPWAWVVLSSLVAGWLLLSRLRLRESEAAWRPLSAGFSENEPVYRAETFGPAVVGFLRPRVVLPDWVVELEPERRRLILLHELEHLRARDPALMLAGWTALVLAPWLIPLWWQFRRLRLALEKDCDRRVVNRTGDARGYGRLLLDAKELAGGVSSPMVTSAGSFLADRIRTLVAARPRFRGLRAAGAVAVLATVLLVAGTVPPPGVRAAPPDEAAGQGLTSRGWDEGPEYRDPARFGDRLREVLPAELPEEVAGDTVLVPTYVTARGRVDGAYIPDDDLPSRVRAGVLEAVETARFRPAARDGRAIDAWIALKVPLRS